MITEKELAEYSSLCSTLDSLHGEFLKKKQEIRKLMEETAARKREAFLFLAKANRITRHLTGRQRNAIGLSYRLSDINAKINQLSTIVFRNNADEADGNGIEQIRMLGTDYRLGTEGLRTEGSRRELKQMVVAVVSLIDQIKKQLLQLNILELRCRELISSINKAMEAFRHEEKIIRQKIYPFGVFSLLRRSIRSLAGSPYFSSGDMNDIAALGNMTGLIMKIADSPIV